LGNATDLPRENRGIAPALHSLRTMVGVTIGAALVSPKTIPYTLSLLAVSLIWTLVSAKKLRSDRKSVV